MKYRHRSTVVKRHVTVVHTSIRLSNSTGTTKNRSLEHPKIKPTVTVSRSIRHHRGRSRKRPVVPVTDTNSGKTMNSSTNHESKRYSEALSTSEPKIGLMKNNDQPSKGTFPPTKRTMKSNQTNPEEVTSFDEQLASRSAKLSHEHTLQKNNMSRLKEDSNRMSNIGSSRRTLIDDHHHRKEEKDRRKRPKSLCFHLSSCSCLCAVASIFTGLLVGIAIAATVVALLTNSKTTTTTTTTSTTISTITTSTITPSVLSIDSNVTIYGIWNTTAGEDSSPATPGMGVGNYVPVEDPSNAFDHDCGTKYTSFGACIYAPAWITLACGLDTGFYLILSQGATRVTGVQFCTGNDLPPRDPLTMTLEGSNMVGSALTLGSNWNLIYNGSTGLDTDPGRNASGVTQTFLSNFVAYSSYRILITSKRGANQAVQYSELKLLGF